MARRILISGASRGLGRHLAEHYLRQGDEVLGCARGSSDLRHDHYHHVALDVTDEAGVHDLFKAVRERLGGLDVLINNAGVASMNPIALMTPTSARHILEVNLLGTFLLTRLAVRLLRGSPAGRIVNMTSIAVPLRLDGEAMYAASKSAVETFTRIAAREFGPFGVTCNAIGPSVIRTRLVRGVPEHKLQALIDRQAIARQAEPCDVTNVVDFFLRPESRFVTGQVVYLGGFG